MGPKRLDLGAMWGAESGSFRGCEEPGEVNLALMMRGWKILGVEAEDEGGAGEVWPGWLGGWWRSLEANHIPNQQEMYRKAWIVQK